MKFIDNIINTADHIQQDNRWLAFPYAVIKKYGDDQAGNRAALLTYYGFLALFPLLLVVTTITQIVASNNPELQTKIAEAVTSYLPIAGDKLYDQIDGLGKTGLALVIGLLFTLYGARGVAEAFRQGVNQLWGIPRSKQEGFPKSTIKNLLIVIVGGIGFILAGICAGLAAGTGFGFGLRVLPLLASTFILFWLFVFLFKISLPKPISLQEAWPGALAASIGLGILQFFGSYLLANQLRGLNELYSYFALALGLLFWIYLQSQVVFYSVEIATVRNMKLWPRSLNEKNQTKADKQAISAKR